ncbi:unnamed protein product [Adineta steineri]|uniref:Intradiol ring-cleavage dioxygenases domain-containing protein n=2 Tax=Adineta steineri TaxID=433720 RepID=A0A818P8Y2_9BILA|nr:unnamed protein product [Adineta steineri]
MMNIILFLLFLILPCSSLQQDPSLTYCQKASSACILTPEQTEGPYYWNSTFVRQNISEDRSGIRFRLQVLVLNVNTCQPIANAIVDLWHCDALGLYSHYISASNQIPNAQNDNQTFLRGLQITNNDGIATFDTIYPGWYAGRTIHIHIKVHIGGEYNSETSLYSGGTVVHTGQLFFNDSFSDTVAEQSPYNSHTVRRTLNSQDGIYASGGSYTLMDIQYENGNLGFPGGLITTVTLGVSSNLLSSETTSTSNPSCGSNIFINVYVIFMLFFYLII